MGSQALSELEVALSEVAALRRHAPRVRITPRSERRLVLEAGSANRRACAVLLCSHFERYLYSLNENAVDHLNMIGVRSDLIPLRMRLLQTKRDIDELAAKQWDNRESGLINLFVTRAHLWTPGATVLQLDPAPNLEWMKSPKVKDLLRFFDLWGVVDILAKITRAQTARARIARTLQSLVDSRNGIAHGDRTVQPSRTQITEYLSVVRVFAERSDKVLGAHLGQLTGSAVPW